MPARAAVADRRIPTRLAVLLLLPKDEIPCTTVAPITARMRGRRSWVCPLPKMSSIRYLVEAGRTRPDTRLISINTKLRVRSQRRGLTKIQIWGSSFHNRSDLSPLLEVSPCVAPPIRCACPGCIVTFCLSWHDHPDCGRRLHDDTGRPQGGTLGSPSRAT